MYMNLKGFVSVYFKPGTHYPCSRSVNTDSVHRALNPRLGLWVSLEHAFTCASTTNQAERRSSADHLLASWEHKRTTAWWLRAQGGGPSVMPTACIHYKLRRLL